MDLLFIPSEKVRVPFEKSIGEAKATCPIKRATKIVAIPFTRWAFYHN